MNRDYPLAPTYFGDEKKKMARQENRQIRREERATQRTQNKNERSTGLEYEPRVTKRQVRKWSK